MVSRRGGRPAADDQRDVRAQLLAAARDLFTRFGFDAVSTRQLAAEAETTPAMIHYYFGDKHGLYRALLEEVIPPVLDSLEDRARRAGSLLTIADFMHAYLAMFEANPWLPPLVFRELQEGGEAFRRHYVARFAGRVREMLGGVMAQERQTGHMPADVEPEMVMIAVMSLCVFPFLARPMLEQVMQATLDKNFVGRWESFAVGLMQRGAGV
ncbi:MAG: TetR/AcrR family transcriptional regulator [Gammaproteobacteria bacterium]